MNEELVQKQAPMRQVLQHIIEKNTFMNLTTEEHEIVQECVEKGYVKGVLLLKMASGRIVMEVQHDPVLTEAGAAFIAQAD